MTAKRRRRTTDDIIKWEGKSDKSLRRATMYKVLAADLWIVKWKYSKASQYQQPIPEKLKKCQSIESSKAVEICMLVSGCGADQAVRLANAFGC